jgi:SAM-dependent methyltransferase
VNPVSYDAWYDTPRGHWIGETEFALLHRMLSPQAGASLLDVGCGTGWFSRKFAGLPGLKVTGLDPDPEWLAYARNRSPELKWVEGDAQLLPFEGDAFDYVVSITALCFVADVSKAVDEIVRVARKRWAIGLLNRRSLLYLQKGVHGGTGAYRGAHWHTPAQARTLARTASGGALREGSAIFLPGGGRISRWLELQLPSTLPLGAFLVVAGDAGGIRTGLA